MNKPLAIKDHIEEVSNTINVVEGVVQGGTAVAENPVEMIRMIYENSTQWLMTTTEEK